MSNIDMARHGEAASVFDGHINPGLSKLDKDQANATAKELDAKGSMQVVTSSGETADNLVAGNNEGPSGQYARSSPSKILHFPLKVRS